MTIFYLFLFSIKHLISLFFRVKYYTLHNQAGDKSLKIHFNNYFVHDVTYFEIHLGYFNSNLKTDCFVNKLLIKYV